MLYKILFHKNWKFKGHNYFKCPFIRHGNCHKLSLFSWARDYFFAKLFRELSNFQARSGQNQQQEEDNCRSALGLPGIGCHAHQLRRPALQCSSLVHHTAVGQCHKATRINCIWSQCLTIDVSVLTFQAQFGSDSADSPDSRCLNVQNYKEIIWPLMIDSLIENMTWCCAPVSPRWCIVSLTQATAFLRYGPSHMHHSAPDTPDSVTTGIPPS